MKNHNPCAAAFRKYFSSLPITYAHSPLPRPFIFLHCLMHSARFSFFYDLFFLPETFFYAHRNCRFISIGLVPLCTSRPIIKILSLGRIEFFIKCLNRIKFIFPHNRGKMLFHIGDLLINSVNLLL